MSDLVQIAVYADRFEAMIVLGALRAAGIDAIMPESFTLDANPGLVFAIGGARILAPRSQEAEAHAVLRARPAPT